MNGESIRELRKKKRMSIDQLSDLSGVSKSYISYIERGLQNNPSIAVIEKISKALDVQLVDLIEGLNKPPLKEEHPIIS
ncbi:XRE family transcriptional regulator [Anaerobacillus alkaliphilus]|uniref:XRE family transcriptional regulator n=1 Tax=Anaerobacillus alkaliphilus TaxID=1548597 RepID=A0A4Q0VX36_9BACI|nr:helix-turn-helix transcriptional regulator [Anaerobacillus alkaliphilus]RXJ04049.1 XRE family transcriptional regulator [Anaerobacillus alkaliphilus]